MKTGFTIRGTLKLKVKRADGSIVEAVQKNLVMKWGLANVASYIAGANTPATLFSHLAMGTGALAPTETDSALGAETQRDAVTITQKTGADANLIEVKVSHALGAITGTFKEAGLFDAATTGNMFNRAVFSDFPVSASDTLTVIWIIEVKNI